MAAGQPIDDGLARHLLPGRRLPDVPLPSTDGQLISPARITGRLVLMIYPWTGRPGFSNPPGWDFVAGAHGSTPAAEGFRDAYGEFSARGISVFGLSTQSSDFQRELVLRLRLPFPILSDAGFVFSQTLGLPMFIADGVTYLKRLTLVANGGAIDRVLYPVRDPARQAYDAQEIL